jgi:hypothetical protein
MRRLVTPMRRFGRTDAPFGHTDAAGLVAPMRHFGHTDAPSLGRNCPTIEHSMKYARLT